MTELRTTNGLGLRGALRKARTMPDPEVNWSEWIAAIEAEATAAAEQRLRERIEAELVLRSDESDPFEQGCDAAYHFVLSLLGTPPAASPRQGEPVAVARFIEAVRRSALLGRREPTVMLRMWVKYAEVIQRHYAALSEPAEAGEPG